MSPPPKPCWTCGEDKGPGQGRKYCDACCPTPDERAASKKRQRQQARPPKSPRKHRDGPVLADVPEGMKWCPKCKEAKPIDAFGRGVPTRNRPDGKATYCKACYSAYSHARRLAKDFNLTPDEYATLLTSQDGKCAICLARPRTRRLAVDHNHKTLEIRGLLCTRCNHKLLGAAHEKPEILRRAALYLEEPPASAVIGLRLAA